MIKEQKSTNQREIPKSLKITSNQTITVHINTCIMYVERDMEKKRAHFSDEASSWDKQMSCFLVLPNLTKSHRSWPVAVRFLSLS